MGRDALTLVTKQVSESGEWKNLDSEDEDDLLREMQDEKEMKANIKVTGCEAGIDIENTLARVQPEVECPLGSCQCTTNVYY
jgi:hypothetical protein